MAAAKPLKPYTVTINGLPHTLMLDDETAKRYGDRAVPAKTATPANKARTPQNKAADNDRSRD